VQTTLRAVEAAWLGAGAVVEAVVGQTDVDDDAGGDFETVAVVPAGQ